MIDDAQLISKLLAAGLADQNAVQKGISLAEENNQTLYETLIFHQLVPESDVVQIASDVLNVPSIVLSGSNLDKEMAKILPADIALRNQTLPLEMIDDGETRVLRLAMSDPIDVMAMDEVASHTGVNIRPVLVGPADLKKALSTLYPAKKKSPEAILLEIPKSVGGEDSWAALFEDSEASSASVEDSAVISQEMRDRPPTDVFEVVEEEFYDEDYFEDDALAGLNDESEGTQIGNPINLDQWDLDDAFYDNDDGDDKDDGDDIDVEEFTEQKDSSSQTRVGVGTRGGYDALDLDDSHFADPDEDDDKSEEIEAADEDQSSLQSQELNESTLKDSIEMALNTMDVEVLEVGDEKSEPPEIPLSLFSESELNELGDISSEEAGTAREHEDEDENEDEDEDEKDSSPVSGIRAALKRAAQKKQPPTKKQLKAPSMAALGRIKVKRIAVPAFKGVVEKRSDQDDVDDQDRVDDQPTTREISAADLASLAFDGESDYQESGLAESTKNGGEDVATIAEEMKAENSPLALSNEVDDGILLRGLLQLIMDKGLVSPTEVQTMIEELTDQD